jgi:hypothetical protein
VYIHKKEQRSPEYLAKNPLGKVRLGSTANTLHMHPCAAESARTRMYAVILTLLRLFDPWFNKHCFFYAPCC